MNSVQTFAPGPTPNTVQVADGKVLTVPEGWGLLPLGDAALTRRVEAAGDHWVVAEKKGRKAFSMGISERKESDVKFGVCSLVNPMICWRDIGGASRFQ